ncbi:MAG: uncharacterized protein PWQ87_372 [Candidatus Woesearchaeota archaeon]|nr:uncharacterized protein [Candidatus Woesearchaeota archaeon]
MLTLEFVPYSEIANLSSVGRIRKLLNLAKEEKIVVLQGRLKKEEEAELIKATMEEINKEFKGIELAVIYPNDSEEKKNLFSALKLKFINAIVGDSQGLTIIGPASIVKEIKKDPHKIQIYTSNSSRKSTSNKKSRRKR